MGVLTNVPDLPNNITGVVELYDYVVVVTPLFWPLILMALGIIIFSKTTDFGASRALLISSLITGVFGIAIALMDWMDPKWMYLFGVLLAISLFWRSLESGEGT